MTTPAQSALQATVGRLGLTAGQVIQEFGYDSDVDDEFRFAVEDHTGTELEDEEYQDVADVSLIWWRQDDGDLVDAVVDALTNLGEGGSVVVLRALGLGDWQESRTAGRQH